MGKTSINLFKKPEKLVSIDIGASGIRVLESEFLEDHIEIQNFAYASFNEDIYQNQLLAKQELVAQKLINIFKEEHINASDVVTAVPGGAAFSKKITTTKMDNLEELDSNIKFESNAIIPHGLDGVYFDYALLKNNNSSNNIDVFITAVKKDIVNSIQETLNLANLNLKILDIDYLALLNLFEFNYPELKDKTVALVDVGGRYSTVNVCSNGEMLFSTNIPIGGRLIAEELSKEFNVKIQENDLSNLENIKIESNPSVNTNMSILSPTCETTTLTTTSTLSENKTATESASLASSDNKRNTLKESLNKHIEKIATDLKRQLKYYSEAGTLEAIEKIFLTGGGVYYENIHEIFKNTFNTDCETLEPLKKVKIKNSKKQDDILKRSQQLAVLLGLSLRKQGDSKKRYKLK